MLPDIGLSLVPDEAFHRVVPDWVIHSVVHNRYVGVVPPGLLLLAALSVIVDVRVGAHCFLRQPAFYPGAAPVAAYKADRDVQGLVQHAGEIPGRGTEPSGILRVAQFPFAFHCLGRG